ncbi:EthD domain-containing protein [Stachybotrys elegans]|uniref:EthD domain-containing protein n=1 Tax=Stachybotrys elegans TaxID=80388 RepID=A0A8K0SUZ9_9HYPO|nr:EthD domain-containing protein [Stachybotrys elegans]
MARLLSVLALTVAAVSQVVHAASCHSSTGHMQMVTYVKRHPEYTREEFWEYWETQHAPKVAPLAAHFNITRYQQIQVGGQILPTAGGSSRPASNVTVEFDGIAMFLYKSADVLTEMLSHPYYINVVEPDEHVFIDKAAFGTGMVATFIGSQVEVVNERKDVWIGDESVRAQYQEVFDSYQ